MGNKDSKNQLQIDKIKYQSFIKEIKKQKKQKFKHRILIPCSCEAEYIDQSNGKLPMDKINLIQMKQIFSRISHQWYEHLIDQCEEKYDFKWIQDIYQIFSTEKNIIKFKSIHIQEIEALKIALCDINQFDLNSRASSTFTNNKQSSIQLEFLNDNTQYSFANNFQNQPPISNQYESLGFDSVLENTIIFEEEVQNVIFQKNTKKQEQGGSNYENIIDDSILMHGNGKQSNEEYNYGIQLICFYKRLIEIIEAQFKDPNNLFNNLLQIFKNFLILTYSSTSQQYYSKQIPIGSVTQIQDQIINHIRLFIKLFLGTMGLYYLLDEISQQTLGGLLTKDNLYNFIITIIFDNSIYGIIYEIYKIQSIDDEKQLQKNVEKIIDKEPQDLDVQPIYCLNNLTKIHVNKQMSKIKNSVFDLYKLQKNYVFKSEQFPKKTCNSVFSSEREIRYDDEKDYYYDDNNDDLQLPYNKTIQCLRNIVYCSSPLHKLKIIAKCITLLYEEINDFYKQNKIRFKKFLCVESDDILNIIVYIIAQSHIPFLQCHLKMTEDLLTTKVNDSKAGYYRTTFQAAIEYIKNIDKQKNKQQNYN